MLKGEGLEEFGNLHHDPDNPEYIALGGFRDGFNFQNLNRALRFLLKGAKLVVMITEITDNSMGELELTVGAYGKMLLVLRLPILESRIAIFSISPLIPWEIWRGVKSSWWETESRLTFWVPGGRD